MSEDRVLRAAHAVGAGLPGNMPGVLKETFGEVAQTGAAIALEHYRPLVSALRSIAANTCCARCQEAALVARKALREAGYE